MIRFQHICLFLFYFSPLCASADASDDSTRQSREESASTTDLGAPRKSQRINESWPMTSLEEFLQSINNQEQQELYEYFMKGCYKKFGRDTCDKHEKDRLAFNSIQPPLMRNFTTAGYAKVPMPATTSKLLQDYLDKFQSNLHKENWGTQTYTNHWKRETHVHNIEFFMPLEDRKTIQREVQEVLEGWSGVPLIPTSMYGIRIYREGAILAPHVDRLPLVISAILNVAQDEDCTDEWPLEVIGRDGIAVNLTLQPGEMILYESHSIIHGRPYPLTGWFYANVFLHFEPVGYSYELKQKLKREKEEEHSPSRTEWARAMFHQALESKQQQSDKKRTSALTTSSKTPDYVIPDSEQEMRWEQNFIFHREAKKPRKIEKTVGATPAHTLAANGDLDALKREVAKDPTVVDRADVNGWKPIHEAARGGQTHVIEYLIDKGVDVNERTHDEKGGSPLWWAQRNFPDNHPAVEILRRHGAVALAPRDN